MHCTHVMATLRAPQGLAAAGPVARRGSTVVITSVLASAERIRSC
jgi:phage tail protein X